MNNSTAALSTETDDATTSVAPISGTLLAGDPQTVSGIVDRVSRSSKVPYVRTYTDNEEALSLITIRKTDGIVQPYGSYNCSDGTVIVYLTPTDFDTVNQVAQTGLDTAVTYQGCAASNISLYRLGNFEFPLTPVP